MDSSEEAEKKYKLTLVVMNWVRLHRNDDDLTQYPLDIIKLIVNVFLYQKDPVPLPFHTTFNCTGWVVLSDDNKCATSTGTCRYALVDIEPITDGCNVFRVQVS